MEEGQQKTRPNHKKASFVGIYDGRKKLQPQSDKRTVKGNRREEQYTTHSPSVPSARPPGTRVRSHPNQPRTSQGAFFMIASWNYYYHNHHLLRPVKPASSRADIWRTQPLAGQHLASTFDVYHVAKLLGTSSRWMEVLLYPYADVRR